MDAFEYLDEEVEKVLLKLMVVVQVVLAGEQPRVCVYLVEKYLDCVEQLFKDGSFGIDSSDHSCELLKNWLVFEIQDDFSFFRNFLGRGLASDFLHLENAIKAV